MRAVLLAVAVCVLFAVAQAQTLATRETTYTVYSNTPLQQDLYVFNPNEGTLCMNVGRNSGCSGCVLGTKALCSWIATKGVSPIELSTVVTGLSINDFDTKRNVEEANIYDPINVQLADAVDFSCVPSTMVDDLSALYPGQVEDVSHQCPQDPSKEPPILAPVNRYSISAGVKRQFLIPYFGDADQYTTILREKSVANFSKAYDDRFMNLLPGEPVRFVDRTAMWSDHGYMATSGIGEFYSNLVVTIAQVVYPELNLETVDQLLSYHPVDCDFLNSEILVRPELLFIPSNFLNQLKKRDVDGVVGSSLSLSTHRDLWCAELYLNAYLSTRCPPYGMPVSGICSSFFFQLMTQCQDSSIIPYILDLHPINPGIANIFGLDVVEDSTLYCLGYTHTTASDELLRKLQLDKFTDQGCA